MLAHKGKAEVDFVGWNGGSKLTSGIHHLLDVLSFEGDTSAELIDQNRASPKTPFGEFVVSLAVETPFDRFGDSPPNDLPLSETVGVRPASTDASPAREPQPTPDWT